jgi:hypothetical protein
MHRSVICAVFRASFFFLLDVGMKEGKQVNILSDG